MVTKAVAEFLLAHRRWRIKRYATFIDDDCVIYFGFVQVFEFRFNQSGTRRKIYVGVVQNHILLCGIKCGPPSIVIIKEHMNSANRFEMTADSVRKIRGTSQNIYCSVSVREGAESDHGDMGRG